VLARKLRGRRGIAADERPQPRERRDGVAAPNRLLVSLADKALGREGRMLRALDEMGPGNMLVEGRPFRVTLE